METTLQQFEIADVSTVAYCNLTDLSWKDDAEKERLRGLYVDSLASSAFGEALREFYSVIERFHSDLYHDAQTFRLWLTQCLLEAMLGSETTFPVAVIGFRDCGTNMGIDSDVSTAWDRVASTKLGYSTLQAKAFRVNITTSKRYADDAAVDSVMVELVAGKIVPV